MFKLFCVLLSFFYAVNLYSNDRVDEYYSVDEDGEVIDKCFVVNKMLVLLKSTDVNDQITGAKILSNVLPLPPNERMFFSYIDLLLSSEVDEVYNIGIRSIVDHMNNNKKYWSNDYHCLQRIPMLPGATTVKWLKLIRDISDRDDLCLSAVEQILESLSSFIKSQFRYMSDDKIKSVLLISKIQINQLKLDNLSEAELLFREISKRYEITSSQI